MIGQLSFVMFWERSLFKIKANEWIKDDPYMQWTNESLTRWTNEQIKTNQISNDQIRF